MFYAAVQRAFAPASCAWKGGGRICSALCPAPPVVMIQASWDAPFVTIGCNPLMRCLISEMQELCHDPAEFEVRNTC